MIDHIAHDDVAPLLDLDEHDRLLLRECSLRAAEHGELVPFDVDLDERDVVEIEVVERGQLDLDLRTFAAGDLWLDGRAAFVTRFLRWAEEFGHTRSIRQCTFDQLHVVGDHLAEERGEVRDGLDRHDVICLA